MQKKILKLLLCCVLPMGCTYLPESSEEPVGVEITETREFISIDPVGGSDPASAGLLYYPGGLVDPHAYISLCAAFAASGNGHRVLILKMPANLAVLDLKAAQRVLADQDERDWVIAGHSLGGAMGCSMVAEDVNLFRGMILFAAYPAESVDLSTWEQPVLSITASEDQVLDWENFEAGKPRLPQETIYTTIAGGNHAGFGKYGPQEGDGTATISQEEQESQLVDLMQNFFIQNELQ
ncbi:MAG: hypothetical protein JW801_17370 [Bacteroidales bacterium]|nr:hypothetical protein [Bacteroidales bacterium]